MHRVAGTTVWKKFSAFLVLSSSLISGLLTVPLWAAELRLSAPPRLGAAVMLEVRGVSEQAQVTGRWQQQELPFTADHRALLPLDMEAPVGVATLEVTIKEPGRVVERLQGSYTVAPRIYKEEPITLPKAKVEPDPEVLARIERESRAITATYERRGGRFGYDAGFQQPVQGRFSGVFGSRRVLNGKPRKPHNGVDIAAPQDTPVVAAAAGVVALVGVDYFFTGNTLVLDHGHGVVTLYAHLASMAVQEGQWVAAGQVVGAVGMSGRATGPHLHWGALVRQQRVDPLMLPGVGASDHSR
ncbi:MAG: M23 family metallopeptidase [Magnetococcales bacterium]|nr:M23 family metallopeptidase [Magnetococcales bacterium]MBF0116051.1 M23 family metallopeptidase [Magnetococcales bacterium]